MPEIHGEFNGMSAQRGHLLRTPSSWPQVHGSRRTRVLILGGGVAGLAAARALRLQGMQDFALLELEDVAGGNSRSTQLGGLPCPMGAHYLPTPSDAAPQVQDLLEELGLRQRHAGRWLWDERHLCHSPQERLFFRGQWQEGLLPLHELGPSTLRQYRQFGAVVERLRRSALWTIPSNHASPKDVQLDLDAQTFGYWLDRHGFTDPQLRWYLDYCCRDDYGADIATVSAWAGIHYFASRHGFHIPGDDALGHDGVFTWPEGNAWLTQRLAAPLHPAGQLHTGQVVVRITPGKHRVEVDCIDVATNTLQRWRAEQCIVALPVQVAARVLASPPTALTQRAASINYAAWVVANVHVHSDLADRPGAAPSWDNVVYSPQGQQSLGYVDATHQSLHPVTGARVLTWYQALGSQPQARRQLQELPWTHWRDALLTDLYPPHPDLREKITALSITRHAHAMAVPAPGTLAGRQRWAGSVASSERLLFAHSDWAGYSVFEEAFSLGHEAGRAAAVLTTVNSRVARQAHST